MIETIAVIWLKLCLIFIFMVVWILALVKFEDNEAFKFIMGFLGIFAPTIIFGWLIW